MVEDSPALAGISSASIQGRIVLGPRAGGRVWRVGALAGRSLAAHELGAEARLMIIVASFLLAGCPSGAPGSNAWQPSCPSGSYADVSIDRWFDVNWNIVQGRTGP